MASLIRRSKLETYIDILHVIGEGIDRPTHVMYKSNVSWIALQHALKTLINQNFLTEDEEGNRKKYKLTNKGFRVLEYYSKVRAELIPEEITV
jgi:predicted transcriptional regulator